MIIHNTLLEATMQVTNFTFSPQSILQAIQDHFMKLISRFRCLRAQYHIFFIFFPV